MKDGPKTNSCRQNSEDEHRKRNDTKEEKTLNYKRDPRILRKQPDSIKKARGLSQLSHKGESNYYCVVACSLEFSLAKIMKTFFELETIPNEKEQQWVLSLLMYLFLS